MSTAKKLKTAEQKIAKAQRALDETKSGLHAAGEVMSTTEKAPRRKLVALMTLVMVAGLVWLLVRSSEKN